MNLQHAMYENKCCCAVMMCFNIFLAEVKSHKHNKGLKFCEPGGLRSSIINISAQKPHGRAQKFCNVPALLCNYHKCFLCMLLYGGTCRSRNPREFCEGSFFFWEKKAKPKRLQIAIGLKIQFTYISAYQYI